VTTTTIDVTPDINGYFEQVVDEAIRVRRVRTSEATAQYLAALLGAYARGQQQTEAMDKPLTFLLRDALETTGAERFQRLRGIGDGVLYVLGFFGACLTRRGADRDYVIAVGSSAYGHASAMLRLAGSACKQDVLSDLAGQFGRFVEVMSEISDSALAAAGRRDNHQAVLRLYERWQRTGSTRLADQLVALGVCPTRSAGCVN